MSQVRRPGLPDAPAAKTARRASGEAQDRPTPRHQTGHDEPDNQGRHTNTDPETRPAKPPGQRRAGHDPNPGQGDRSTDEARSNTGPGGSQARRRLSTKGQAAGNPDTGGAGTPPGRLWEGPLVPTYQGAVCGAVCVSPVPVTGRWGQARCRLEGGRGARGRQGQRSRVRLEGAPGIVLEAGSSVGGVTGARGRQGRRSRPARGGQVVGSDVVLRLRRSWRCRGLSPPHSPWCSSAPASAHSSMTGHVSQTRRPCT